MILQFLYVITKIEEFIHISSKFQIFSFCFVSKLSFTYRFINNSREMNESTISQPLKQFQHKIKYFYFYNATFTIWSVLALIYYIVITANISSACSPLSAYFIAWTCSYALEIILPLVCCFVINQSKMYWLAIGMIIAATGYKVAVIATLAVGAWGIVGTCYISSTQKTIIIVINALEIVCLIFQFALVWRIKSVNREIAIEKLIQTKTFAQN